MTDSLFEFEASDDMLGFSVAGMTKGQLQCTSVGLHPLGARLAGNGETCGSCDFVKGRTYKKCGIARNTLGPGTDVRLKWAACVSWRLKA